MDNSTKKIIEKIWLDNAFEGFPRDIGFPNRILARNKDDYLREIWSHISQTHIYNSLFSTRMIEHNIVNKIYIDFDGAYGEIKNKKGEVVKYFLSVNGIKKPYQEMKKCVKKMNKKYGCIPRINFTAGRGFGIYIDFPEIILKDPKYCIIEFVKTMTKGMLTIDHQIIGDVSRLYRLPYTIHPKTKLLCVPFEIDLKLEDIVEESKKCLFRVTPKRVECREIAEELLEIDSYEDNTIDVVMSNRTLIDKGLQKIKPKNLYENEVNLILERAPQIKDGRHRILHFLLVPRLILMNKSDDEILKITSEFIENTNRNFEDYKDYVLLSIKRNREGKNKAGSDPWRPWSLKIFKERNIDIKNMIESPKKR